jgi:ribosomal protein S4E
MELAERFDFEIEERFVTYFDRIKEKTAESRMMLAVNDGRHVVLVGDTIMISINNAEILEEFENELGIV